MTNTITANATWFKKYSAQLKDNLILEEIPSGTTLLYQGELAHNIYLIKSGCLRLWHNDGEKDITLQFFFEEQMVAAFESIYLEQASLYLLEAIADTTLYKVNKEALLVLLKQNPEFQQDVLKFISARFISYQHYFLARIKDSPAERYQALIAQEPRIVARVPQHYIASYLGITPVSLSRIKNHHVN